MNDIINQIDLKDIHEILNLVTAEYTFFSSAHETFSRTDHLLGHKTNLNKFQKTEIIQSIFSDHNRTKLEISIRRKTGKFTSM